MKRRRRRSASVSRRRPARRARRAVGNDGQVDAALTAGAVLLQVMLEQAARYCEAASQELRGMNEGRSSPRDTLLRLSSVAQQYLSSLATVPARLASDMARRTGPRAKARRQGRVVE
jgi:hypothetical protein